MSILPTGKVNNFSHKMMDCSEGFTVLGDEITKEEAKKFAEPDQDLFLGNYQQVRMK